MRLYKLPSIFFSLRHMFYIHQSTCISPQQTFADIDLEQLNPSVDNRLVAIEPVYQGISPGLIRRMGKAVRMGVGSALPLLKDNKVDGIIIGTANGGIEDSLKFLSQIMEYEEGTLTPTHFVQSTYNAIAGQLGMISKNTGYNSTHVQRGHAFEGAMLDAALMLRENPDNTYLVGGVDEISERNHRMETMDGWYKTTAVESKDLYSTDSVGTLPGEGAAMFLVNNHVDGAIAKLAALRMLNTESETLVAEQFSTFLADNNLSAADIDLYISGENGDNRLQKYYTVIEAQLSYNTTQAHYKHAIGEFQTSTAIATWFICQMLKAQQVPEHFIKSKGSNTSYKNVVLYNNYKGAEHSFMLVQAV